MARRARAHPSARRAGRSGSAARCRQLVSEGGERTRTLDVADPLAFAHVPRRPPRTRSGPTSIPPSSTTTSSGSARTAGRRLWTSCASSSGPAEADSERQMNETLHAIRELKGGTISLVVATHPERGLALGSRGHVVKRSAGSWRVQASGGRTAPVGPASPVPSAARGVMLRRRSRSCERSIRGPSRHRGLRRSGRIGLLVEAFAYPCRVLDVEALRGARPRPPPRAAGG
jgi:hypothetical protein